MSNPSKAKGTKAESDLVRWARGRGFPHAERLALSGALDGGDIRLTPLGWSPGLVVVEVKAHAIAGRGIPADALLAAWMGEAERERVTSGADHCPLVLRRTGAGAGDPGRWWAWLPSWSMAALMTHGASVLTCDRPGGDLPVLMRLDSLAILFRLAGYGAEVTGRPLEGPWEPSRATQDVIVSNPADPALSDALERLATWEVSS